MTMMLVDGHVHLHACFDERRFFESAWHNFDHAIPPESSRAVLRCLCLTESAGADAFTGLEQSADRPRQNGAWCAHPTDDGRSLRVSSDGREILVVAGRQIVASEGLELLGLGLRSPMVDGMPLRDIIAAARELGAVPVLPWGFGKWWRRRGRVAAGLLEEAMALGLYLGDNGNRPAVGPTPRLFAAAARRGVPVLPGSDPLPFPGQERRAGACGFILAGEVGRERPADQLLDLIRGLNRQPPVFGRYETVPGFVRAQLRMQWRKRQREIHR